MQCMLLKNNNKIILYKDFVFKQGKKVLSSLGIVETAMPERTFTNGDEPWGLDIIPHSFSASEVDSENLPALRSGRVGLALLVTGKFLNIFISF